MRKLIWVVICIASFSASLAQASKTRVFVAPSNSTQFSADSLGIEDIIPGIRGGSRPQRVELMKTLTQKCPELTITVKENQADYTILFDRAAKDVIRKDSKIAVFNKQGELIHTSSTRSVGSAVKNACRFIP